MSAQHQVYAPGTPMGPPPTIPLRLPGSQGLTEPPTAPPDTPTSAAGRALRKRPAPGAFASLDSDPLPTSAKRTSKNVDRPFTFTPKLKLKVSDASDKRRQSFLGPYDRELDSDDEDLVFEEQFILKMPPGEDCEKIRAMASKRSLGADVWFKFKDSRRAVFHVGGNLRTAKLVDLPCIIESQKTLDNKHMFKVADICQMLVVEDNIVPNEETAVANKKIFNANEFIWPHGITPPLKHVRKRRFRKRLNRQAIENVEKEVDRLLSADKMADSVDEPIIIENADPNASDSEFLDPIPEDQMASPHVGSDGGGNNEEADDDLFAEELEKALRGGDDDDSEEEEDDEDDQDGEVDDEDDEEGSGSDGSDDEDDLDDDEDEDDDDYSGQKKVLDEEIKQLEHAIRRKDQDIETVLNPALKTRFLLARQKMNDDLQTKLAQREQLVLERQAARVEANEEEEDDPATTGVGAVGVNQQAGDDLFGDDGMDVA